MQYNYCAQQLLHINVSIQKVLLHWELQYVWRRCVCPRACSRFSTGERPGAAKHFSFISCLECVTGIKMEDRFAVLKTHKLLFTMIWRIWGESLSQPSQGDVMIVLQSAHLISVSDAVMPLVFALSTQRVSQILANKHHAPQVTLTHVKVYKAHANLNLFQHRRQSLLDTLSRNNLNEFHTQHTRTYVRTKQHSKVYIVSHKTNVY